MLGYFLATPCGLQDLKFLDHTGTHTLGSESAESQSLDCQGIPLMLVFKRQNEILLQCPEEKARKEASNGVSVNIPGEEHLNLKQANGKPLYMTHWLFWFFPPEADTIVSFESNTNMLKIAIINSWPVFFKSVKATEDRDWRRISK